MSTSIEILGMSVSLSVLLCFTGFFGGLFPFMSDLITRQKVEPEKKIDLDIEFFLIKLFMIPIGALVLTALAVAFGAVNNWLAALYLGGTLPLLVEKVITNQKTVDNLAYQQ
ncbi:hypothetical protein [Aliivibrio sp. 1S128]|uniref:hypothetical protein n=1 Tax=Aliivibrio sp. 1S128 TaxID=1840085 RepID=UPI00080ECB2C|nr:hypothetical protein [Aliivibrio sp. 1S128]OCH24475.1 hypothetical protein A6E03_19190 [Aliivibrio sp. 1S128]